jgi:hypothetical protein
MGRQHKKESNERVMTNLLIPAGWLLERASDDKKWSKTKFNERARR